MALLTVKQNGVNVEGVFGSWTRSLHTAPDFGGGIEWDRPAREVAAWGARFEGPGVPKTRQSAVVLRCEPGASVVDLEHAARAEVRSLNNTFNPASGELKWTFASTDSDSGAIVTSHLWARVAQLFTWRDNPTPGSALEVGVRRTGRMVYPVLLTSPFPWFCQAETIQQVTGDHTSLSGTVDNPGIYRTGWQLKVTMGAGTGINLDPFSVTVGANTLDLTWDTDVDLDGDDVLVVEWFYPDSVVSRYGFVSYYLNEGAGDPTGIGLVTPDITTYSGMPWIAAGASGVGVGASITGAPSGSVSEFNFTSLHGSV